jgi:hypothetical protein
MRNAGVERQLRCSKRIKYCHTMMALEKLDLVPGARAPGFNITCIAIALKVVWT